MKNFKINVEPLVNREFLYLENEKNAFQELFESKVKKVHFPFITVSREPGSGGKLIAKRLAAHLNYKFYDREIIEKLKAEFQREKANYQDVVGDYFDEKDVGGIEEFIGNILYPNLITQDHFVKHLIHLVTALTLKGRCVVLGRGANFFTDHRFGFHVRITAPFDFRVANTVKYEKLSEKEAAARARQVSQERKHFVEKYFSRHIDNSEFYDLVLNRQYYSLDEAVNLILNAFKRKIIKARA